MAAEKTNKEYLEIILEQTKVNAQNQLTFAGQVSAFMNEQANINTEIKSYLENNVQATKALCEICLKCNVKKFIFSSSSSVYGDQKKFPILEKFETRPKNYYAITKMQCEKIVAKTFSNSKTNFIIFTQS